MMTRKKCGGELNMVSGAKLRKKGSFYLEAKYPIKAKRT